MEDIYTRHHDRCELVSTRQHKIKFLLEYSQSLNVVTTGGMTFENNMN